ncbi:hypothetical protein DW099_02620 [Emergencia timonensis]|uniref:Uncharacterized protein n=1 Tax=Emergencia timonensis TaxID=1776384 RepID=A0A415E6R7_9FIRM|nr:hypothetical protein DW099_02620 [Emergencia timonensis]
MFGIIPFSFCNGSEKENCYEAPGFRAKGIAVRACTKKLKEINSKIDLPNSFKNSIIIPL